MGADIIERHDLTPRASPSGPSEAASLTLSRQEVGWTIVLAALTAALLLWVPWLRPLGYPFRLLLTLVHELSHGLAVLLTGGTFHRLVVFANGAGLAYTSGGWRWVVIPAGYLGAAAFGAALVLLGTPPQRARRALVVLGIALGLLSLRYGVPTLFSSEAAGGLLAVVSGVVLGLAFVAVARAASARWVIFAVYLTAFAAGWTALSDLLVLLGISVDGSAAANDARSMAEATLIPAVIWALLWALAAAGMLAGALRRSFLR